MLLCTHKATPLGSGERLGQGRPNSDQNSLWITFDLSTDLSTSPFSELSTAFPQTYPHIHISTDLSTYPQFTSYPQLFHKLSTGISTSYPQLFHRGILFYYKVSFPDRTFPIQISAPEFQNVKLKRKFSQGTIRRVLCKGREVLSFYFISIYLCYYTC